MRILFNCILIMLFWFGTACRSSNKTGNTTTFEKFDLFHLRGESVIEKKEIKNEYVEIKYEDSFPVSIKFIFPEREVTLLFKDSFSVKENPTVYVFSTSNFHGGRSGPQKQYTGHYEEFEDLIFTTLNDTIVCQSYRIPAIDDYDYKINVYVKLESDSIKSIQGQRSKNLDKTLSKEKLYLTWIELARQNFPSDNYPDNVLDRIPQQ